MNTGFKFSERTRILTPRAVGLTEIVRAIAEGASIIARQVASDPIEVLDQGPQRLLCQSSGSTGTPKTICRTPQSWIASFEVSQNLFGLGPDDSYAVLGHPGHSLALFAMLEAMHIGAGLACLGGQSPKAQLTTMAEAGTTTLYATPAQLRLIVTAATATNKSLPSMRTIFSGGGKMDDTLRTALTRLCPSAMIHEFYGASETSFITMTSPETPDGSVGPAYPGVEISLRESEIWVRSPYLFEGYAQGTSPDTRRDGDWLSVGEMGYQDSSGNLYLLGRKTRMVTIADQNIYPDAVEAVLQSYDGVKACAVVSQPDPLRGHHLVACIAGPKDAEQHLRQTIRERLGPASVPRRFVFIDALPLLPAGKPDLIAVRTMIGGDKV